MLILSIDGGGIRGYYAAHVLKQIKDKFGVDFSKRFDLIAGTSTGSIIAAALATDVPIEKICELYELHGHKIFKPLPLSNGWFWPKYSARTLKALLEKEFPDLCLKDTKTRLMIPAADIGLGQVHVFKSSYNSEFTRDPNVPISEAVLASCSAPLYFSPTKSGPYLLADGGLWANNPSLVAITEAMTRLKTPIDEIKLLSIGTGIGKCYYGVRKNPLPWGFISRWNVKKFIDMLLNLQSAHSQNAAGLLLKKENYVRINFESDQCLSLDDTTSLDDLKARAHSDFTKQSAVIKKFLEGENNEYS